MTVKRFVGPGGFLVAWATKYIIRWLVAFLFYCQYPVAIANGNISLRGLMKSMRRRAYAHLGVHDSRLDDKI